MINSPKWHRELSLFIKIKSTFILEGNIYDEFPLLDEDGSPCDFFELDRFLNTILKKEGYNVCFYDPINGFYNRFEIDDVTNCFSEINIKDLDVSISTIETPNDIIKRKVLVDNLNAGIIAKRMIVEKKSPTVVILNFASRYLQSATNMSDQERDIFTNLLYTSLNAKNNFINSNNLRNLLFIITDKINDLPAWLYLDNPNIKNIFIPMPDKIVRNAYINYYFDQFIKDEELSEKEIDKYISLLVDITDGMKILDLRGLREIKKQENISFKKINDVVSLYKYGIKENPWDTIEIKKLKNAVEFIRQRVKGQDLAVHKTVDVIKRAKTGLSGIQHSSKSKPKGILFFAGPTGTGKTELAKTLAELLFGDESAFKRFDMSEYSESHSSQKLFGAPPGYVGYEAGGQLTNTVKEYPFSILLFDEIEKAHASIWDKFLQILEDGRMTDGQGNTVYFSECIIIFTSNLGIYVNDEFGKKKKNVFFEMNYEELTKKIIEGVKNYFYDSGKPEVLNRIGNNLIVFNYIREEFAKQILYSQLKKIHYALIETKNIELKIHERVRLKLEEAVINNLENGGRGIGNVVEESYITPLSSFIFDNDVKSGEKVLILDICNYNDLSHIKQLKCEVIRNA